MTDVKPLPMPVVEKLEESRIPQGSVIFYQNSRWVFRGGSVTSEEDPVRAQPFDSLGPFDIHAVNISFQLFPATSQYTIVSIHHRSLKPENPATGYYAPMAQITLEGFARSTANIPDEATHFCWLYPPSNISHDIDDALDSSYEGNLLKLGGFAYFKLDEASNAPVQLIRVNALIVLGEQWTHFRRAIALALTVYRTSLVSESVPSRSSLFDRYDHTLCAFDLQPVTLSTLRDKGARYYAFINPDEEFSNSSDRSSWTPSPNGAFAYLFNEDHSPHPFDCYFSVSDNCLGVAPSDE